MALNTAFAATDALGMRQAMGRAPSGVAVVTAKHEGELVGMTISSLTSISLEPPILMVSLTLGTRTVEAILGSGAFAVSVLGVRQEVVARQFAKPGGVRFEDGDFDETAAGLPVVANALVQAHCLVERHEVVGDHRVVFGTVTQSR